MIPLADMVAFSTSVSNQRSSRSTALMVMSWTRLCWSRRGSVWKRRSRPNSRSKPGRSKPEGVGRDHRQDRLHEARHVHHRLGVLVVGLGVDRRVAVDLAPRARVVVHAPEVVAVRHGRERAVQRQDLEAVAGQVELADDLGPQQRDHVRADGELEAGEDLLGHRRSAQHVPALEHEHLAPGAGQVGGVHEAVVAAADDDRVVPLGHGGGF